MKILVTGSTGFVGRALVERLVKDQFSVSAAMRNVVTKGFIAGVDLIDIGDVTSSFDWGAALIDVDVVIHLVARTHILNDLSKNPLAEYRYINVDCSLNLARQAAKVGVKRFIYLSTIKVNGESTAAGEYFTAEDTPSPIDFYGISKYEAELGLSRIADGSGMELVIIRPPLVYGSGVKGNFLNMMEWISRSIPLPLGNIKNRRSLIALDNLVDLLVVCIRHTNAANQIFLASDDEDLSTSEICIRIGIALHKPARLFSIPVTWLYFFLVALNRRGIADRLCLSLCVDISKTKRLLGWTPKVGISDGLAAAAHSYINVKSHESR